MLSDFFCGSFIGLIVCFIVLAFLFRSLDKSGFKHKAEIHDRYNIFIYDTPFPYHIGVGGSSVYVWPSLVE